MVLRLPHLHVAVERHVHEVRDADSAPGEIPGQGLTQYDESHILAPMTSTTITPGYNCRLAIFFTHDKNGNKRARYYGKHNPFRSFPIGLAAAEQFIAQDLADQI